MSMTETKTPPPSGVRRNGNKYTTQLKTIQATLNPPQALPQKQEYLLEVPDPPPNLESEGIQKWNWVCRRLLEDKNLRLHWLAAVQQLCECYDFTASLKAALKESDILVTSNSGGTIVNPLIGKITAAEASIRQWLVELRLTPRCLAATSSAKERTLTTMALPKSRKGPATLG